MSVSPGAPALTVARLAALLVEAERAFHGLPACPWGDLMPDAQGKYEELAAWLLPRLGPVGAPTPAMIAAAARTAYRERYGVSDDAWDQIPEVGDNSREVWRRIVEPVLRAALAAQEEPALDLRAVEMRLKDGSFVVRRPLTPEQVGVINDVWRAQTALVAEVLALRAALTAQEPEK